MSALYIQVYEKESLNSDGHQFYQYQQNQQSSLILTDLTEHKKTMTYDVGNPGPGLARARKCDGLNRLMGSQPSPLDNWISDDNTYI